jgi:hypothetical protein
MKKVLLIGGVLCLVLFGCCGGFLYWGYSLNKQEARRDYDAAEELWSTGNKAEAVEKYRNIKRDFLNSADQAVVAERIREFDVEQAKKGLAVANDHWTAGRTADAAAKYRSLQLDLLEQADQDTVKKRLREFDSAKARKDVEAANRLWTSGEKTRAIAIYNGLLMDLLDPANQKLVTQRLYEAATRDWEDGRKAQAAAVYKRLQRSFLSQQEGETMAERIKESDDTEKKFAGAERTRHGRMVKLIGIDLYYMPSISTAEARNLGDFLDREIADPEHRGSAQITRDGKTYQYRMVVKKGIELDEERIPRFKKLAQDISLKVFDGADVEVHLCDDQLKTRRVVIPLAKP